MQNERKLKRLERKIHKKYAELSFLKLKYGKMGFKVGGVNMACKKKKKK